jgi:WD40 repeat protein
MSNNYGGSHGGRYDGGGGGGGRDYGGGGGGRYDSGGRGGRGGRGRGRGGRNSNSSGGRSDQSHANVGPKARLRPCGHFVKGNCQNGNSCHYAHVVKLYARLDASNQLPPDESSSAGGYQNQRHTKFAAVSAVSIWETQGTIKIFTGSHDGFWRLWNTQGSTFTKEFEHNMGGNGKVECLEVASNFLFCGFEAISLSLPDVKVGMIHAWNLANPTQPPLEFHMHAKIPYAHATCVTQLIVVNGDTIISGCRSGVIRLWKFMEGAFVLQQTIHGHAREITGLVVVDNKLLWSASIDGSIRLWDLVTTENIHVITKDTQTNNNPCGHTGAVTGLITCQMPGAGTFVLSSSLDGTIKAWNGQNGECVASEDHQTGVVSMALSKDLAGNPILLIGLDSGNIMVRNLIQTAKAPAFSLLFTLTPQFSTGHYGAVKTITEGPQNTFYTGGADGKLLVLQISGDMGI